MKQVPFIELYSVPPDEPDRWVLGDIHIRRIIRKMLSPFRNTGAHGLHKVGLNLSLGLKRLGIPHRLNQRAVRPRQESHIGVIHAPIRVAKMIAKDRPCLIGPGVLNLPEEWPDMFSGYQATSYIQACEWQGDVFRRFYGEHVKIWPVGIDTENIAPSAKDPKALDFFIYDKRRWPDSKPAAGLLEPLLKKLDDRGLTWSLLRYGKYPKVGAKGDTILHEMARNARAMLFLCENETQGIAYNEVLSLNVPILAWDQGFWQDPVRVKYGLAPVPATSVPYWDARCGVTFQGLQDFDEKLGNFLKKLSSGLFEPRKYVLENLCLEQKTRDYLQLLGAPMPSSAEDRVKASHPSA